MDKPSPLDLVETLEAIAALGAKAEAALVDLRAYLLSERRPASWVDAGRRAMSEKSDPEPLLWISENMGATHTRGQKGTYRVVSLTQQSLYLSRPWVLVTLNNEFLAWCPDGTPGGMRLAEEHDNEDDVI